MCGSVDYTQGGRRRRGGREGGEGEREREKKRGRDRRERRPEAQTNVCQQPGANRNTPLNGP